MNNTLKHSAGQHDVYGEECKRCPALVKSRKQVTFGFGAIPNTVMFVGEAPGQQGCNITGIPFTRDRSGYFFQNALRLAGFIFKKIYITNIIKCSPPGNRNPEQKEIENCEHFLAEEIKIVKPVVIIAIGRIAATRFLGKENFSIVKQAGEMEPANCSFYSGNVILIPHPAYIIRNGNKEAKKYIEDLQKVFMLCEIAKTIDTTIYDKRWKNGR